MLLLLIILILLFGGGGGVYYGNRAGWQGPQFGGLLGTILIVILILWLLGGVNLRHLNLR